METIATEPPRHAAQQLPPPASWQKVAAAVAAIVTAAFGAGATTSAAVLDGGPAPPTIEQVRHQADSITSARLAPLEARIERIEAETEIAGCVARAQIAGEPLAGCAYLANRRGRQ